MELMARLRAVAMAVVAAAAPAPALTILIIRYKVDLGELAVVVAAAELTNLARRLRKAVILLAAAAARAADLLTEPRPRVELIPEISAEDLEGAAPIPSDQALGAAAAVEGAVSGALSLSIAI